MTTDRILQKIQINLIDLANEIQRQREFRLKATGTRKEKKEHEIQKTCYKLKEVFKELGYEKTSGL